jgi:hypothetical protein
MYFHKSEGALVPDGVPDGGAVAMAPRTDLPGVSTGVPDVSIPSPGALPPSPPPARVIDRPIPGQSEAPGLPPAVLPAQPTGAVPVPPRIFPPTPNIKEPGQDVTQLPPRREIFQLRDNSTLERQIRESILAQVNKQVIPGQAKRELSEMIPFPAMAPTVPPGTPYVAKTATMPPGQINFEPGFVIHHRLHFEEKNSERYGWDLGIIQPAVSLASFYKNMLLWPNSLATGAVVGFWDTNMGKCLPGSPTPYYLYPQGLTVTGGVAEGLVITGISFIIP